MHAGFQFAGERFVDGAVAGNPAHAGKFGRDDSDAKMRFARTVERLMMARMLVIVAGMQMAFVDHEQSFGTEELGELGFDGSLRRHFVSWLRRVAANS